MIEPSNSTDWQQTCQLVLVDCMRLWFLCCVCLRKPSITVYTSLCLEHMLEAHRKPIDMSLGPLYQRCFTPNGGRDTWFVGGWAHAGVPQLHKKLPWCSLKPCGTVSARSPWCPYGTAYRRAFFFEWPDPNNLYNGPSQA